jgi:hypothetical protein
MPDSTGQANKLIGQTVDHEWYHFKYIGVPFQIKTNISTINGHCATSWRVAGSITDGVIGNFHWHNHSGRTMALESIQSVTELSPWDTS